jgi:hypothetical protein
VLSYVMCSRLEHIFRWRIIRGRVGALHTTVSEFTESVSYIKRVSSFFLDMVMFIRQFRALPNTKHKQKSALNTGFRCETRNGLM